MLDMLFNISGRQALHSHFGLLPHTYIGFHQSEQCRLLGESQLIAGQEEKKSPAPARSASAGVGTRGVLCGEEGSLRQPFPPPTEGGYSTGSRLSFRSAQRATG